MSTLQDQVDAIFERPPGDGVSLAMVVQRAGAVVAERYGVQPDTEFGAGGPVTEATPLISWSMAKSFTHAAVGLLVADGLLDVEAPAPVPAWAGTPKAAITVLDLLEMRSGLEFVEDYVDGESSNCIAMLFGAGSADHATYAAGLPLEHEPGTVWNYSSGATNIISRIVGDIVCGALADASTAERRAAVEAFMHDRLFGPLGMDSSSLGFDAAGNWVGSSYVHATARDFARFGELYRSDGVAPSGDRILPEGWVEHAHTWIAHDPTDDIEAGFDYGRHWWGWPEFDCLGAHGYEGQFIVIEPERELVVVHLGKTDTEVRRHLVTMIAELIRSA